MDILSRILAQKRKEVKERAELYPVKLLEKSLYFGTPPVSLRKYLLRDDKSGIIAEFKRMSPSRGIINKHASVEAVSIAYMQAGASALSVLTDAEFFGGSNADLTTARKFNFCPILRKDFIFDEYQVIETKSIGADAMLLIAAVLEPQKLRTLAALGKSLCLEILLEVHGLAELKAYPLDEVDLVGVNNRNLKTLEVDVRTSFDLAGYIPDTIIRVSESGISQPQTILELRDAGYGGFLIGEHFMAQGFPGLACADFIRRLNEQYA